jgi:hypothetical protein
LTQAWNDSSSRHRVTTSQTLRPSVKSPAFSHGHQGADRPHPHGGPVSVSSELWSYQVATGSPGSG